MTGRIHPNHKAGSFLLLGSGLYFVQTGGGQVHRGGLKEAVKVTKIIEILDSHEANYSSLLDFLPPIQPAAKPVPGVGCVRPTPGC